MLPVSACVPGHHGHLHIAAHIAHGGPSAEARVSKHPSGVPRLCAEEQDERTRGHDEVSGGLRLGL